MDPTLLATSYAPPLPLRPTALDTPMLGTEAAKRAQIQQTAQTFEASFLSSMIGEMFEGVETAPPFGGGEGEAAFRSFLTEAMGKSIAKRGGIGLSKAIEREMLKMQGLS